MEALAWPPYAAVYFRDKATRNKHGVKRRRVGRTKILAKRSSRGAPQRMPEQSSDLRGADYVVGHSAVVLKGSPPPSCCCARPARGSFSPTRYASAIASRRKIWTRRLLKMMLRFALGSMLSLAPTLIDRLSAGISGTEVLALQRCNPCLCSQLR